MPLLPILPIPTGSAGPGGGAISDPKILGSRSIIEKSEYDHLLEVMRQAGELPGTIPYKDIIRTDIAEAVIEEQD